MPGRSSTTALATTGPEGTFAALICGMGAQLQIVLAFQAEPVTISIAGEAAGDAAPFASAAFDLSSRDRTTSTVMWEPEGWEDGESGLDQRTPDLTDVIQAIIEEPGWSAGNALALFFEDTTAGGDRVVESFEGAPGAEARLVLVALDPNGAQVQFELAVCMPRKISIPAWKATTRRPYRRVRARTDRFLVACFEREQDCAVGAGVFWTNGRICCISFTLGRDK